jgi:hypothetical protein
VHSGEEINLGFAVAKKLKKGSLKNRIFFRVNGTEININ